MLAVILGAFLVGVALASVIIQTTLVPWIAVVAGALGIAFVPKRSRMLFFILIGVFLLGTYRFTITDSPTLLEGHAGHHVELEGYVDGDFSIQKQGASFYFRVLRIDGESVKPERILVRTERWPTYSLGLPLTMDGQLEMPWQGDDFDYRAFLKKDGVRVLIQRPDITVLSETKISLWGFTAIQVRKKLTTLRDAMSTGIQRAVSEPASAYLNGIILGIREDLPDDISDAFSRTGTTHVLAISGYNVAIVAQGFMLLCLRVVDRRRAVWLAVCGIAAFALLTGASASVVRAAIMGSLVLVANAWGRQARALNLVLIAAAGMVALNPYLLRYDIGFQLSFAAVLGLVYFAPWFERMWSVSDRFKGVWQMTAATGAANVATLPLILTYFGTLPIYSLPANIMILPLVPYAMAWGTGAGLVALVLPSVSVVVGVPAWALATWQLTVVKWFGQLPWSTLQVSLSWSAVLAVYAGFVFVFIHYGNRRSDHSAT